MKKIISWVLGKIHTLAKIQQSSRITQPSPGINPGHKNMNWHYPLKKFLSTPLFLSLSWVFDNRGFKQAIGLAVIQLSYEKDLESNQNLQKF